MTKNGDYAWYELLTEDVEGATAFYPEAVGWKTSTWGDGPDPYLMWMVGDRPLGGVMKLPDEAKNMGAPSHWTAYIAVDDVDACARTAEELGGKVLRAPFEVQGVGRIAVFQDPQGATFSLTQFESELPPGPDPKASGVIAWNELNTTDYESAFAFYSKLLGWAPAGSMEMGDIGTYFMFKTPGSNAEVGGMSNTAAQMSMPSHWLYYIQVSDLDDTLQRVRAAGGKVLAGPAEIPGGGRFAQCTDPQGVPVGFLSA